MLCQEKREDVNRHWQWRPLRSAAGSGAAPWGPVTKWLPPDSQEAFVPFGLCTHTRPGTIVTVGALLAQALVPDPPAQA